MVFAIVPPHVQERDECQHPVQHQDLAAVQQQGLLHVATEPKDTQHTGRRHPLSEIVRQ